MTMCPNSKRACECQPQDGVMCPHGPTPPFQPWAPEPGELAGVPQEIDRAAGVKELVPVPDEDPARAERGYVRMVPADCVSASQAPSTKPVTAWIGDGKSEPQPYVIAAPGVKEVLPPSLRDEDIQRLADSVGLQCSLIPRSSPPSFGEVSRFAHAVAAHVSGVDASHGGQPCGEK
jgi:hypothetical protein